MYLTLYLLSQTGCPPVHSPLVPHCRLLSPVRMYPDPRHEYVAWAPSSVLPELTSPLGGAGRSPQSTAINYMPNNKNMLLNTINIIIMPITIIILHFIIGMTFQSNTMHVVISIRIVTIWNCTAMLCYFNY